jgi:hypothetical protein
VRVAYVAATRVCDLLVAPVVGDEQGVSWLSVLNSALYFNRGRSGWLGLERVARISGRRPCLTDPIGWPGWCNVCGTGTACHS